MSDSARSGEKRKRNANDDGAGEKPESKQGRCFALLDFVKGGVPVFEEIVKKNMILGIYHMEMTRFVQTFSTMGTKLAKAVSTQKEIIATVQKRVHQTRQNETD